MTSALYALDHGVSVVICNGMQEKAIKSILSGRKLGTFFTENTEVTQSAPVELIAENGKYTVSELSVCSGLTRS